MPKGKRNSLGCKGWDFFGGGGEGGGSEGEEYKEYTILCILYSPFFLSYLKYYLHGPVVHKPINANPGLTVNQSFCFSCHTVGSITSRYLGTGF